MSAVESKATLAAVEGTLILEDEKCLLGSRGPYMNTSASAHTVWGQDRSRRRSLVRRPRTQRCPRASTYPSTKPCLVYPPECLTPFARPPCFPTAFLPPHHSQEQERPSETTSLTTWWDTQAHRGPPAEDDRAVCWCKHANQELF